MNPADIIFAMSVYLHDIPLAQARSRMKQALQDAGLWGVLGTETILLDEKALGRVLADAAWAKISSPNYHASAMDGFAVSAQSTNGAQPSSPLVLLVAHGDAPKAAYVDTGDPLPGWADAVIPIENVEPLSEAGDSSADLRRPAAIRIRAAVTPWSHVRPLGEDIVATQLVLPKGHVLRPVDLGALAAAGHQEVRVARKPRVAVLPTGTELVPIGSALKPGDILEFNSLVLTAQINGMGGEATRFPITQDDFGLISERVRQAAQEYDLVLLNAGSSAGAEDFSARVIDKLGSVLVHGVAVRPGHPVILGMLELGKRKVPIVGVPGFPVSAALTIDIFVEPLIAKWLGRAPKELPTTSARLTRKITSPAGDEDYVRVALGKVADELLAAPLSRGAGVITSLVQADGLVVLSPGTQGAEAGERVTVRLYRTPAELERTILCIGSHDVILDLLAQFLAQHERRFVAANVGSQGGLIALRRGEAHVAGSHLLDPQTGEYNVSYIREYMPGIPVKVVALVGREQGLLVRRGNPKGIRMLQDLSRPDIRYVNRQRGAGTRVLLDYHLKKAAISADSIQGYNEEEYTHLGVAAAVASGRADCGLAIAAAAQALDLDFIPLFQERYDLVMPKQHAGSELLKPLFTVLEDEGFRAGVSSLPGYDISVMGRIILEDG